MEVEFDDVYARFRDPVWRLVRRMTRDEDEALDVTQEVFYRIWRGLPGFRGAAKLSTWVFQIAWNTVRTQGTRRSRRPRLVALSEGRVGEPERRLELRDPHADPERRAAAGELLERVDRVLAGLPEGQRAAVWLRDGEGMSYEEIAAALGVPVGTVRSRLARARATLRSSLGSST